jgi:cytidylate kinase
LVALNGLQKRVALDDETAMARLAASLDARFLRENILLNQEDVSDSIRTEAVSEGASRVAALPQVRQALFERQRAFRQPPGLVADGRDMGSVVFPDATLKVYLTADAEARAQRRYKQLKEKGMDASITILLQDIRQRDARDSARAVAPLQKSNDAILLDTTKLSIEAAVEQVLARYAAATRVP